MISAFDSAISGVWMRKRPPFWALAFVARFARLSNAAKDLAAHDAAIVAIVASARIGRQLASTHAQYVTAHVRHGQQLAVQFLLEDMRSAAHAVPAILRGESAGSLPKLFVDAVRKTAQKHGEHSRAFGRIRDRAFLAAHESEVAEVAALLRRDAVNVQEALLATEAQSALAIDVGLAAQRVLAVLRIVTPRTMQRLLATSGANATTV